MTALVVDASIIGGILLADEWNEHVPTLLRQFDQSDLAAPAHWAVETANLLTMAMRRGRLSTADRDRLAASAAGLPVTVEEAINAIRQPAILALADETRLTVYDAAYLELAERTGAGLATNDRALADVARARGVPVYSTSL